MLNHTGTVIIETPRLRLRRLTIADADAMFETWASDAEVTRYLTWLPHESAMQTRDIIETWLEAYESLDCYNWGLELKETGALIGSLSVVSVDERIECFNIGYCMGRAYWGRGLMTEALGAVCEHLFGVVGANRVEACHDVNNPASGRVMQKCGLRFEGILRDGSRGGAGEWRDVKLYALLKRDRG